MSNKKVKITTADAFIKHFGVKGMRWGVIRSKKELAKASGKSADNNPREDGMRSKTGRKSDLKNRRKLSNQSLKTKIKRLEDEKKFKNLSEEDLSPGKAAVKRILKNSGEKAIESMLTGTIKYATKVAMTKTMDIKDAADYIVPKPKKK